MSNQPRENEFDELVTIEEVAEILKVPVATIRKWRSEGSGPQGFRVGKYVRFRKSAVEDFIRQKETDS
ncbi:helix-turn-helix transcriptional regulator [Actinoplanes sp. NPDC020271]|uniref:helix-turn-helix transcriptional regulator n=1 Tax=Actinoplanes sp. NPDC020271 TaxID=3363896 RepID=UPI0037AA804B